MADASAASHYEHEVPRFDKTKYRKHLWGWFSYAFASEVFVIASVTLFLPICLEQFARDNGFLLPNKTEPCSSVSGAPTTTESGEEARCVVKLGWFWVDTASFSLYVLSFSVALQALVVISMGGIADHPAHRKKALLSFAALGSTAAVLFLLLPSTSPLWPLVAVLAVCANVGFGASMVTLNAYIPTLAHEAQEVLEARNEVARVASSSHARTSYEHPDTDADAEQPLLAHEEGTESSELKAAKVNHEKILSATISRISSQGIAMGYSAGIIVLILTLIPVTLMKGSTDALRLAIGLSGLWWALFTLPAAAWLPGASATAAAIAIELDGTAPSSPEREWRMSREIVAAWKRLGRMLHYREVRKLRNTFVYLAAWFLLSDGFTTITNTAILFGKTVLHMPASSLILIGAISPTAGIAGSLVVPMIQRRRGWSNLQTVTALVIIASLVPAYGCLGFLPFFQSSAVKFGGLTTPGEMFVLAVYFGSVYGAFQGYARALYAEIIPPGEEARWYALFSITDKSSSFLGPLVVGVIADTTGNIRYAFFFLTAMIWLSIPVLTKVNMERGRADALRYMAAGSGSR
ncbi:autophagy-type protein 22 [Epithele typhae]|uniref:autophagy-type protein 22 n=1 Tax=Epithele typhae TaxID=378194 RepID=UPI002007A91E|nr:autophagy-type protein 22 [Epithele typhae]KAH9915558.1 autophagy-type protein 22 [Epithele typhae]